jgi:hypothetical protein
VTFRETIAAIFGWQLRPYTAFYKSMEGGKSVGLARRTLGLAPSLAAHLPQLAE